MKRKIKIYIVAALAFIITLAGYLLLKRSPQPEETLWTAQNSLVQADSPVLLDEMEPLTLIQSIDSSLRYFEKKDPVEASAFGDVWISNQRIIDSLNDFKDKLNQYGLTETFFTYVSENYDFYQSAVNQEVLITGYFEADLRGSLTRSETFRYPLYRKPDDLLRIDLSKFYFYENYKGLPPVLRGRVSEEDNRSIVPYFDRAEIDQQGRLEGQSLEIVWIDNPIDVFFLQIQGSGIVELDTGNTMRVNYAESNGHPYRAIGKWLLERELISYENMSMQSIRKYLENNPQQMDEIFNTNPSYIFFREVEEGPIGSIGVPLTPMRSIATDKSLFPKGALCFIDTTVPVFDEMGNVTGWKPFRGFILNQDTGGAIEGPGRADLFTGYGRHSRLTAGHMKQKGTFYFLIKK